MLGLLKQKANLLRALTYVSLALFALASILSVQSLNQKVAHAATNNTVNFQARLLTAAGAVVPDSTYSIQFKIWNASSAGSVEWTETDGSITTKNGYFTVSLGAGNAFSNATIPINWDQQQWLTMNVNG